MQSANALYFEEQKEELFRPITDNAQALFADIVKSIEDCFKDAFKKICCTMDTSLVSIQGRSLLETLIEKQKLPAVKALMESALPKTNELYNAVEERLKAIA